jgi:thiol:disulfide interchange protein DsbC
VIVGSVYEVEGKVNLTEQRLRKLNRVDVASLPLDWPSSASRATASASSFVFSDADCPFCAKLENELKQVDNVTIYTFLFPIDQLHPDSARKSRMIWCSPDKVKAWDAFFASGTLPDNAGDCDNPVERRMPWAETAGTGDADADLRNGSVVPAPFLRADGSGIQDRGRGREETCRGRQVT